MKRYGNLWPKIIDYDNCKLAIINAAKGKHDRFEVVKVFKYLDVHANQLLFRLRNHKVLYKVAEYKFVRINDCGKERELAKLPFFPDKVIQWAIMQVMEPYFMKIFTPHTCASIKGRGINTLQRLMRKYLDKRPTYCLKIDVKKFYPSIDHDVMKKLLRWKFKDVQLLLLLDKIIDSYPKLGLPIGSYLSQFLANYYLTPFDYYCKEKLHLSYVIRYMDDVVIMHDDKEYLHEVRELLDKYLKDKLKLTMKSNWQIFPIANRPIDFGGYRFSYNYTLLRNSTKKRMVSKLKDGLPFNERNRSVVASYQGWLKHCDSFRLQRKYIEPIINDWRSQGVNING